MVISFIIAGTVASFFCCAYAEMAAMLPASAGAYSFAKEAFGRLAGALTCGQYFTAICPAVRRVTCGMRHGGRAVPAWTSGQTSGHSARFIFHIMRMCVYVCMYICI